MAKALSLTIASTTTTTRGDLEHYAGEDVVLTCTVESGSVTGLSLTLTIRDKFSGTAYVTKSGSVTNSSTFTLTLASADTVAAVLNPSTFLYEIERTDSGHRTVLARGRWTILPQLTL